MTHVWDGDPAHSIVTVRFEDLGARTRMTFTQTGFGSDASRDGHHEGWSECFDILDAQFGGEGAGQIGTIVFRAEEGVNDPEVQQQMEAFFAEVAAIPGVVRVESPYVPGTRPQIALQGPEAGKIAFANVELPDNISFTRANEIGKEIIALAPPSGLTLTADRLAVDRILGNLVGNAIAALDSDREGHVWLAARPVRSHRVPRAGGAPTMSPPARGLGAARAMGARSWSQRNSFRSARRPSA